MMLMQNIYNLNRGKLNLIRLIGTSEQKRCPNDSLKFLLKKKHITYRTECPQFEIVIISQALF